MNKLLLVFIIGTLFIVAAARKIPKKHSDFFSVPSENFILGYFLDWGHGPFDPTANGMTRVNDLDMMYYSFYTLTQSVNVVWGGSGYANGSLVEGYFAEQCIVYNGEQFENSFCNSWQESGFCPSNEVGCITTKPAGSWCGSERLNPIATQCSQKGTTFGISVGGWSDTIDTPYTTDMANTVANNIYAFINTINNACSTPVITAIDFDWEHLSDDQAWGTRAERINAFAQTIVTLRNLMPELIISYTTRFNAFLNFSQDGTPFASNQEGITVAQAFTALGQNIANVVSFVNIMAYDTPPDVISSNGWTIQAYEKILQSFDNRFGGIFSPSQLVMGIETGQQAAGGIYPGYDRTMCLFNYIKQNGYQGIFVWAPNQFTYRYNSTDYQAACNFTGTVYNETAWNIGWPSGTDPKNPNCLVFPINTEEPQFNQGMADCIENIGPFMANQARGVFDGTIQVTNAQCSANAWIPCGMCTAGQILVGTTCQDVCTAPLVWNVQDAKCECPTGQVQVNSQCLPPCPTGQTFDNNGNCQCPTGQTKFNSICCPTGQVGTSGTCQCPTGQQMIGSLCCPPGSVVTNGACSCPTGQVVVSGQCCPQGSVVQNGQCSCTGGQVLINGQCGCQGGQVLVNNQCTCQGGQQFVNGQCSCQGGQTLVSGQCSCQGGQVLVNGQCSCQGGQQFTNGQCSCPSGQSLVNNVCACTVSGQTIVNNTCQCPSGQQVSGNSCVPIVPTCPENSFPMVNGNSCPSGNQLSQYPGCCCSSCYMPDLDGDACEVTHPTSNCTTWMITHWGKIYGIPLSWCYEDCYAPDAYPIGLHIACSPWLYSTDSQGHTVVTNQRNIQHQFCGCTEQPGCNSTMTQTY